MRQGFLMFRVRVLGPFLAPLFVSAACAEQPTVGSLTTSPSSQSIPKYAFGVGSLSPNSGTSGMGSQASFGVATPASVPADTSFATIAGVVGVVANDPARWT